MTTEAASDRIAIVTVHGTGDSSPGPDGPKWWQRGSDFAGRLTARLRAQGVEADIEPHIWSGANAASDREAGADTLAHHIKACAKKYRGVHIIGHSHGGNVANDAADFLRWGRQRRKERDVISSVTTVGTPFFDSRTGTMQKGAGWAFMGVTWVSLVVFPLVALFGLIILGVMIAQKEDLGIVAFVAVAFALFALGVGLALRFMWGMSTRGVRRVMRPKRIRESPATLFAVWHPNDEAISFLQKIEEVPIEAVPKGALYRGSRAPAVSAGVLAVIAMIVVVPWIVVGALVGFVQQEHLKPMMHMFGAGEDKNTFIWVLIFASILGAPVIFSLIFLAYRYIVGNLLEVTARGFLNNQAKNMVRSMAYGKDGDQVLCNVATKSHTINTRAMTLEGPVADRMQEKAADAANQLLHKYRWALFSVGADTNASLATLSTDAMTWDSLIHTTYFDQPEVSDAIGDHIAAEAKRLHGA